MSDYPEQPDSSKRVTNTLGMIGLVGLILLVIAGALAMLFAPKPPPGKLIIRTIPAGVDVTIDGVPKGTTVDTGLVILFEETANYHLSLSRTGFETDTSTIWMAPDQLLDLEVVMKIPGMLYFRGGIFDMGWSDGPYNERPAHPVSLRPFYVDQTEVTVSSYLGFRPAYRSPYSGENMPATGISWEEARDYCTFQGKRLPTEAEWERACRGTKGRSYSYGDQYSEKLGRTGLGIDEGPASVTAFPAGNGRLFGMTGNVWEWCSDWYDRDYYGISPAEDPRGPDQGSQRVIRGGAWYSNAQFSRCTHRPGNIRKSRDPSFGFRCVRDGE